MGEEKKGKGGRKRRYKFVSIEPLNNAERGKKKKSTTRLL